MMFSQGWNLRSLFFVMAACLVSGCGDESTPPMHEAATSCQPTQIQILVQEGFQKILCGCNEASGTMATAPHSLTCTFTRGKQVLFHIVGSATAHQLGPADASSAVFPTSAPDAKVHVVEVSAAGTLNYLDLRSPLRGSLVSQ